MAKSTTKAPTNGATAAAVGKQTLPQVFGFIEEPVYYEQLADCSFELTNLPVIKGVGEIEGMRVLLKPFSPIAFYKFVPLLKSVEPEEQIYLVCEWAIAEWGDTGEPPNTAILKQDPSVEWTLVTVYEFVNQFFQKPIFLPKPQTNTPPLPSDGGTDG